MRDRVPRTAFKHHIRCGEAIVQSDEALPVCIESLNRGIHAVECEMVAALAVFGLVIDDTSLNLHLAGGEIALEILHVGLGVPEAPFGEREKLHAAADAVIVLQDEFLDLAPPADRHEEKHGSLQAVLRSGDAGVAHSVTALIAVKRSLARFPAGVPDSIPVLDIKIPSTLVHRHSVVAVARDAAVLGILAEAVAAGRSGDQAEEVVCAKIVYPRPRSGGIGDHILSVLIVEISVLLIHP